MRYLVLASDYDGTLAHNGSVSPETLAALRRLLASGRKLILVTGRLVSELADVFPHLDLFERIVAENGAVLYNPAERKSQKLCDPPPTEFVAALRTRGVNSLSVGEVIVATWQPYDQIVLKTIRDLGLDLQLIFNKDAVMILPSGVNKGTGLKAALRELGFSEHNTVGVGDAENDFAFLNICGFSAAVANALPAIKNTVDLVLKGAAGEGVTELIDQILADDLAAG